jgi:hypothetical protein
MNYQSRTYSPTAVVRRTVCKAVDGYKVFDIDAKGYTIRETLVDGKSIPEPVRSRADELYGRWPNQTDWGM